MKELFDRIDALPDVYWFTAVVVCICFYVIYQDLQ